MRFPYSTYNDAPTGGLFRLLDAEHTRPYYAACPGWRFCRPVPWIFPDAETFSVIG